jgi:hypothetical protein
LKYKQAESDLTEARKGFTSAISDFSKLSGWSEYYLKESELGLARARIGLIRVKKHQLQTKLTMTLQLKYIEVVNRDRQNFAKQWKTFVERAGGVGGISGYLTLATHYSSVIYYHLFLLLPLAWLYFEYYNSIRATYIVGDLLRLTRLSTLFSPYDNFILASAIPIALIILFGIYNNVYLRHRTSGNNTTLSTLLMSLGYSSPRRDKGVKRSWNFRNNLTNWITWILVTATVLVVFKYMIIRNLRANTDQFLQSDYIAQKIIMITVTWVPVLTLYFASVQFIYTFWIGVIGWILGYVNGVTKIRTWSHVIDTFMTISDTNTNMPLIVEKFRETMLPNVNHESVLKDEEVGTSSAIDRRDYIAFAKLWNEVINYFYEIHKLSKEETQKLSYSIRMEKLEDYLSGEIEREPDILNAPRSPDVRYHIIRFVNSIFMNKPKDKISVSEMLPLTVLTPVGAVTNFL